MTEELKLDIIDGSFQEASSELYDTIKSPDRTKSWKNSKLRRKTHSGSPNDKLGGNENTQAVANKPGANAESDKAVPLSPVNQRKWKKSEMKRRSTVTTARKVTLNNSVNEKSNLGFLGLDCFAKSSTKVEVRHSSDISDKALKHKFTCSCMQYLDESTGIVYKLQDHKSYDSPIIDDNYKDRDFSLPNLYMMKTSIMEEDPLQIGTTPSPITDERIQTFAENTKAENIAEVFGFETDLKLLDDTVVELQAIQGDLREVKLRDVWSELHADSCCDQKSVENLQLPSTILESMSCSDSSSLVYLLVAVFSYLSLDDLYEAGRVCRTWRCASQHPALWRNVSLVERTLTPQVFRSLASTCISTQQLTISNCSLEDTQSLRTELKNLYNSMTTSLMALNLHSNSDSNVLIEEATAHCTNLTRLHVDDKILDNHMESIANNLKQLACLNIKSTRCLNLNQFYEIDSVKCLTFKATGLRADEVGSIVEWFPNLTKLHILHGSSVHSTHVKSVFGGVDNLLNITLTDVYVTPRALLCLLCTQRELKSLTVNYSYNFTNNRNFEDHYRSAIQTITSNPLFNKVLTVSFEGPSKPPRSPVSVEEDS